MRRWVAVLVFLATTIAPSSAIESRQKEALLQLNLAEKLGWDLVQEPCVAWKGISCTEEGDVDLLHVFEDIGLVSLSPVVGELRHLTTLFVVNNALTRLPSSIGELSQLEVLSLFSNRLTALPVEIGELKKLTRMSIGLNQITQLPSAIGRLKAVTEFDLAVNRLKSLPPEIGSMKALKRLSIDSNNLTSIPTEIGSLALLTELSLSNNILSTIPSQIGGLVSLVSLSLAKNKLTDTSLPSSLSRLVNLEELFLANNKLTTLGDLSNLDKLRLLYIADNQFTEFPDTLLQLPSLKSLHFSNNKLTAVPKTINKMVYLTLLDVSNNKLTTLPKQIGSLAFLESLHISGNQMTELPREIAELKRLKVISAKDNPFSCPFPPSWFPADRISISGDCLPQQLAPPPPPDTAWIYAVIALGVILLIVVVIVGVLQWRKRHPGQAARDLFLQQWGITSKQQSITMAVYDKDERERRLSRVSADGQLSTRQSRPGVDSARTGRMTGRERKGSLFANATPRAGSARTGDRKGSLFGSFTPTGGKESLDGRMIGRSTSLFHSGKITPLPQEDSQKDVLSMKVAPSPISQNSSHTNKKSRIEAQYSAGKASDSVRAFSPEGSSTAVEDVSSD